MDVTQDHTAMLPSGDYEKLDKREKEAFDAMQERIVQMLMQECSHFHIQFPGLRANWRFQAEVYQDVLHNPSTIRYSQRVY